MVERILMEVRGVVQGVGFRPFVHSLATSLELRGFVQNRGSHVFIDVEGDTDAVQAFRARLPASAPPQASVEHVRVRSAAVAHRQSFAIAVSESMCRDDVRVAPDIGTCGACVAELFDPGNRRYRYPFINCTACGPRYTIVRGVPYDRVRTTMAGFTMCAECRREYDDPSDRRFHAEPIACPACGPTLAIDDGLHDAARGEQALAIAVAALRDGRIVAVKGLGGFHFSCDATNEAAVARLRARKHREAKPLAVMISERGARGFIEDPTIRAALTSPERPIVLVARDKWRPGFALAPGVAPGCPTIGVMLPYAPLHHVLLHDVDRPLVMTSGNRTDEPMAYEDSDAVERLGDIVDLFLTHDRPIHVRCDDSIVRVIGGAPLCMRRARGYAPGALNLAEEVPAPLLAVGGHLKNAFCLATGHQVYPSPHVGDLEHLSAYRALAEGIVHYRRLLGIDPVIVAHDLHPEYLSTRLAQELPVARRVPVQHHHAHVLSCAAEHGVTDPVIGVAFDGAGLGTDGAIWGGEFLIAEGATFARIAHLKYVSLPGGDRAAREPWRMAVAHAFGAYGSHADSALEPLSERIAQTPYAAVRRMVGKRIGADTSSVGRLFDAVAALLGVREYAAFEGQAAIEVEALASGPAESRYAFDLSTSCDPWIINPAEVIRSIVRDVTGGHARSAIAAAFHDALAGMIAMVVARIARRSGIRKVALTGGVFQNALLTERAAAALSDARLEVLLHRRVPCNDGGLAVGQAIAASRLVSADVQQECRSCV